MKRSALQREHYIYKGGHETDLSNKKKFHLRNVRTNLNKKAGLTLKNRPEKSRTVLEGFYEN
jgi:hypothetical protein